MTPFIIYALPRSRTFWLSQFLSVGQYQCHHDQARYLRTIEDARCWLSQDWTGTVETAAVHGWRVAKHLRHDLRVAVVRRPVEECMSSLARFVSSDHLPETERRLKIMDRRLDQVEQAGALSVRFEDLDRQDVCAALFTHCTGYQLDPAWFRHMAPLNLQANIDALFRYVAAHRMALRRLGAAVKFETRFILDLERLEREARALPPIVLQGRGPRCRAARWRAPHDQARRNGWAS